MNELIYRDLITKVILTIVASPTHMHTKKLIWAQIAYKSNKIPNKNPQITILIEHETSKTSNERWKDEVANLLEPLDRWGASNLDKSWQKWRRTRAALGRKQRGEKNGGWTSWLDEAALYREDFSPGWTYQPGLVPIGETNRDKGARRGPACRNPFSPG